MAQTNLSSELIQKYVEDYAEELRMPVAHLFGTIPVYTNRFLPQDEIRLETARERVVIKLPEYK